MSDVIVSGNTVTRSVTPPPTVEVELPAPVAGPEQLPDRSEDADVRLRNISDPISLSEDGHELRDEIRRRKGDAEPPIHAWKAGNALPIPGPSESHDKQLRRATSAMREARVAAMGKQFAELPGVSESDGRVAAEIIATAPPSKVQVVLDDGRVVEPLFDNQPIREADSFNNLAEARRAMSNYRNAQERSQQQLLSDLQATEQAEQKQLAEIEAAAKAPPSQPTQPQVDPLAAEKQYIAAQAQQLYWQKLSESERAAANEMVQIQQWARQAQGDERAAYLGEAERRYYGLQAHMQQAAQVRNAAEVNANHARQQQIAAWAEQQDNAAQSAIKAELAEFSSPDGWKKLQAATRRALQESTGLSDQELTQHWNAGRWRSVPEQKMLARLGRDQLAREGMKRLNEHKRPIPPVTPGAYQTPGGDMDQVRAIERQLDGATGLQALKLAKQLTQARRAAGLLQAEG